MMSTCQLSEDFLVASDVNTLRLTLREKGIFVWNQVDVYISYNEIWPHILNSEKIISE